ncbi:MAG TPA: pantoate--beta-alanine ligase [Thiotrichales bacterium]|nr:pantoate--beta-alanine ligase [Thiotrichales bacterium]
MERIDTVEALRGRVAAWRGEGARVALVPTMGNLHEGHLRLVDRAREAGDRVVVSIFVNPMQFGPGEDLAAYPRTLQRDSELLEARGAHLLFAPAAGEVYPRPLEAMTRVEVPGLSDILCGASRPGHFVGVATVVAKLFNMVQPDVAIFGEKDFQQLLVIRRMVEDLDMPVEIVGVETVREPDGLAMSSRNGYLSAEERRVAPALYRTLRALGDRLRAGDRAYATLEAEGRSRLEAEGLRPDYVAIRRADDLAEPDGETPALVVLAAAWLGRARLIDNLRIDVEAKPA